MIIKIQIPDYIIKTFDATALAHNISTDEVVKTALQLFYDIGSLSLEDQLTINRIIYNGN